MIKYAFTALKTYLYTKMRIVKSFHSNRPIGTYMDRWYIVPPQWRLPFCIRLHHIKRTDLQRDPHDHPYTFYSFVLRGWYVEEIVTEVNGPETSHPGLKTTLRPHVPLHLYTIDKDTFHRIMYVPSNGVWTLVCHPRKFKPRFWGYVTAKGTYVPNENYLLPKGYNLPHRGNINDIRSR